MIFVQFYEKSTGYIEGTIPPRFDVPKWIPACGDRSIIIYDGRLKHSTLTQDANRECILRGFLGWQFYKGDSLTRGIVPLTPIMPGKEF